MRKGEEGIKGNFAGKYINTFFRKYQKEIIRAWENMVKRIFLFSFFTHTK